MIDEKLIEQLRRDIEDWEEQARLWEALVGSKRDARALAKRCRARADQWSEVIKQLEGETPE